MTKDNSYSVIVLAAGRGLRVGGNIKKQFIPVRGKPLLYYPLKTITESAASQIIIVASREDVVYVEQDIVSKYSFSKVKCVVSGGAERYLSVYEGLKQVDTPYVLIHDGARACVSRDIIEAVARGAFLYRACEAAVPATDTIKLSDENGFVSMTPLRKSVWAMQTPQGFETELIMRAYEKLFSTQDTDGITDDGMLLQRAFASQQIKLIEGSYDNIKVTTPKDIVLAESILYPQKD